MNEDPDAVDAIAEWERLLDDAGRAAALERAAADWASPRRTDYLRLLYRLVGEAARSGHPLPYARSALEPLLDRARASAHPAVRRFCARAEALLLDPERFDHYRWCDGGWVFEDTVRGLDPAAEIAAAMLDGRVGVIEGSRRIAELVRHRGPAAPPALQPFLAVGADRARAQPIGPQRRRPDAAAANDAERIDHARILSACERLVESNAVPVAR